MPGLWRDREARSRELSTCIRTLGDEAVPDRFRFSKFRSGSNRTLTGSRTSHLSSVQPNPMVGLHRASSVTNRSCLSCCEILAGQKTCGTLAAANGLMLCTAFAILVGAQFSSENDTYSGHWRQTIDLEPAIRGYTINGAYANFVEQNRGSIAPGKYADLAIISDDLFKIPADKIKDVKVEWTMVGRKEVWKKP